MRALCFHEFGELHNLRLEDVPEPEFGSDEVKIRMRAASINPSDVRNIAGKMEGTTLPRIPGRDFAGVAVDGPAHLRDTEVWGTGGDIGFTRDGSHAEFLVIPAEAVVPKPYNLTFEEAACVGVNYVTAYEGIVERANLQAEETLLVTGARGGVGHAVLLLGQALGAKLIAVDRGPFDPRDYQGLNLLGHVDTSRDSLTAAVRELTDGRGVDIAYDCVGGDWFEPVLSTLAQRGRQIVITSVGPRRVGFDLRDFYHHRLTLLGVDSRALTTSDCARRLNSMAPLFLDGRLQPLAIARRGRLDDAGQLYSYVEEGKGGKAVFVFD